MSYFEAAKKQISPEVFNSELPFSLLTPLEFVEEFVRTSKTAHNRVLTQTMYCLPSHMTNLIFNVLEETSARGVETGLYLDGLQRIHRDRRKIRALSDTFDLDCYNKSFFTLQEAGVAVRIQPEFHWWNYPQFYKGRGHRKMSVVDDVGYIGDMNYGMDSDYGRISCMIRLTEKKMVDFLADSIKNPPGTYRADFETGSLLFDGGEPGESLILNESCALVSAAQAGDDINLMTPWIPDVPLLKELLAAADRGANLNIIVSGQPFSLNFEGVYALAKKISKWKAQLSGQRLPPMTEKEQEVHAKILTANISGNKTVIATTHNFTQIGVQAGTSEIALETHNEILYAQLEDFFGQNGI